MAASNNYTYSDFNTAFLQHPVSNDLGRVYDAESVRRSIMRLLQTNKYERLLDPRIGTNLQRLLFEPMDGATSASIEAYIRETIGNYEPRCILQSVKVLPDYTNDSYQVTVIFQTQIQEASVTFTTFLQRLR